MRRQLLISLEKVVVILKFKPPTFVLPPPQNTAQQKSNHSSSSLSNPGSPSFFPKKNMFSLSKTTPFVLEKQNFFTLHSSSSSFSINVIVTALDRVVVTTNSCSSPPDTAATPTIDSRGQTLRIFDRRCSSPSPTTTLTVNATLLPPPIAATPLQGSISFFVAVDDTRSLNLLTTKLYRHSCYSSRKRSSCFSTHRQSHRSSSHRR